MGNIVDTGNDRIKNGIVTSIDTNFTPRIELAVRSLNAFSGRDPINVTANSERGKRVRITASFEKISKRNNTLHVLNTNDETRKFISDEVSELSVAGTHFDRQPHTHHNGVFSVLNLPAKIDLVSIHSIFLPGLTWHANPTLHHKLPNKKQPMVMPLASCFFLWSYYSKSVGHELVWPANNSIRTLFGHPMIFMFFLNFFR